MRRSGSRRPWCCNNELERARLELSRQLPRCLAHVSLSAECGGIPKQRCPDWLPLKGNCLRSVSAVSLPANSAGRRRATPRREPGARHAHRVPGAAWRPDQQERSDGKGLAEYLRQRKQFSKSTFLHSAAPLVTEAEDDDTSYPSLGEAIVSWHRSLSRASTFRYRPEVPSRPDIAWT